MISFSPSGLSPLLPIGGLGCLLSPALLASSAPSADLSLLTEQQALLTRSEQSLQQLQPDKQLLDARAQFLSMVGLAPAQQSATELIEQLEQDLRDWDERMEPYIEESRAESVDMDSLGTSDQQSGETQIESSGGLYFDTAQAQLSYLGQVRLRDALLHLDCTQGLFVQLELERASEVKTETEQRIATVVAPNASTSGEQAVSPSPEEPKTEGKKQITPPRSPIAVQAQQAYLDLHRQRLYLRGGSGITLHHQHGELHAQGADTAAILCETAGIFYLRAETITGYMSDEQGRRSSFEAQGGVLYLQREDRIIFLRDVRLSHEQHHFESAGAMCLELLPSAKQEKREGLFASFQRSYDGLTRLGATERVRLQQQALAGGQADKNQSNSTQQLDVHAEQLSYDARTGETILTGGSCALSNQQQRLRATGDALIRWAVDGSLYIHASEIDGQYSRPVAEREQPLAGTFRTQRQLAFLATERLLYAPHGLDAQDELSSLKTTGALLLSFGEKEKQGTPSTAPATEKNDGIQLRTPPLAFASLGELEHVYSAESIIARQSSQPRFELEADRAAFSLLRGVGILESRAGKPLRLDYEGQKLRAESAESTEMGSLIQLDEQGDLLVRASKIDMQVQEQGESYTLLCEDELRLHRKDGRIELASAVELRSPDLLLKSPHRVSFSLRRGDAQSAQRQASLSARFPQMDYNFIGLESMDIERGSTLQTPQFSMQNTGRLHVRMANEKLRRAHPSMQGVAELSAEGDVQLLMKADAQRLLYARGDKLTANGYSAEKNLTGREVYLSDGTHTHQVKGRARLHLDARNTATLTGDEQRTRADNLNKQFSDTSKKSKKKK